MKTSTPKTAPVKGTKEYEAAKEREIARLVDDAFAKGLFEELV